MAKQEIGPFGMLSMTEIEEQKDLMVNKLDSKIAISPSFGLWVRGVPHYSWQDEDGVVLGMIIGAKMVTPQGSSPHLLYDILFQTGHKRQLTVHDFMILSDEDVDELWDEEEFMDDWKDEIMDDVWGDNALEELMNEIFGGIYKSFFSPENPCSCSACRR